MFTGSTGSRFLTLPFLYSSAVHHLADPLNNPPATAEDDDASLLLAAGGCTGCGSTGFACVNGLLLNKSAAHAPTLLNKDPSG